MTSRSSHERPSMHPYRDDQSQSQTSLQSKEKRRSVFSRAMGTFKREDLLLLPKDARLSSSSPPPALPALPHMFLELHPPFQRPTLPNTGSNSSWATTAGPPLPGVSPATVMGIHGCQMQHPQPCSTQAISGTILTSHMMLTSPPEHSRLLTEPLPPSSPTIPASIIETSPSKTKSSHPSLSKNPSLM
ncbi:hypothetical protein EDD85DRAFT_950242 [Armillaria nabsnona]|nr:hypothetical protein EDD85DRAFT_950242 [Armillaria nabsnona]